jgi:molybdopterin converting factor small subunit
MKVTILPAGAGERERRVTLPSGASIRAAVELSGLEITDNPGKPGTLRSRGHPPLIILLNGRNIEFLEGMDTPLVAGDVVSVFPASEGG